MKNIILSTAYLAPVVYYKCLCVYDQITIEKWDNYIKQTYRNRCLIAGANGTQTLSIPIEKYETEKCLTKDIRISSHGNWQHLHWNAIVSAYGSSPFFEYYEDDFRPFYKKKIPFLFDFNEELRETICRLIDIESTITYSQEFLTTEKGKDFRELIHPKKDYSFQDLGITLNPYYQVFEQKSGFLPNLSIVDLLFNMGPESILSLKETF